MPQSIHIGCITLFPVLGHVKEFPAFAASVGIYVAAAAAAAEHC